MTDAESVRKIGWDGLEFELPADWELAGHDWHRDVGSFRFEDAFDVRVEAEWTSGGSPERTARVERQHADFVHQIEKQARHSEAVSGAPTPWIARRYALPDGKALVTALYPGRETSVIAFFRLHARQADARRLVGQVRRLMESFRPTREGPVAWRVYDLDLRVPRAFRLAGAAFHAGRKMMVFEYRFRRLFLWQFSLAARLIGNDAPEDFAARFLNRFKGLYGPRFTRGVSGTLAARRPWFHPLGHYEEIGRWCFRYRTRIRHDRARDRLVIAVYHHRTPADLEWLNGMRVDGEPLSLHGA